MIDRFRISPLLEEQLKDRRVAVLPVLRLAGLPENFFRQEKIFATTAELFSLWRAIGEVSGDPGIGLTLGAEPRVERYHPSAIVAVCSRSFGDAVERMARYKQLTCPEEIRLQTSGELTAVEFVFLEAAESEPDVFVDLCLSWILSIGRRGTEGRLAPQRVELARPVRHRELLEKHYGCPVRFKAARNALIFRRSDLERPFVTHNVELLAALGSQLEKELLERYAGADIGEQVKLVVKRSLAGKRPSLQQVARELGLSTRTLQRRLGDAQITFQQLVEETRRELARHYLRQSTMELNEAAFLLGYEDAKSFFRAFHDWEGTTPGEWRSRSRAEMVASVVA